MRKPVCGIAASMGQKIDQMPATFRLRAPNSVRTIMALVLREIATSYGRSPGGYMWAIAEPVAGIALLTFIFSMGFHAPPLGSSFSLFYASGLVPFLVYVELSNKLSQAINYSAPLLSYPRVTIIDAVLARAVLNTATQAIVVCLIMIPLLAMIDTQAPVDLAALAQGFALAICLGFGVGVVNCFLVTRFPVWQRIWSIVNRPMFLLSCIVFTFESVARPFQDWLWFNPIVHVIGIVRGGLYAGYDATYVSALYVLLISMLLSVIGIFLLWRFRNRLLNR